MRLEDIRRATDQGATCLAYQSWLIAEVERLKREKAELGKKYRDRTVALRQAIGMAQESILPTQTIINRWRLVLGWHINVDDDD